MESYVVTFSGINQSLDLISGTMNPLMVYRPYDSYFFNTGTANWDEQVWTSGDIPSYNYMMKMRAEGKYRYDTLLRFLSVMKDCDITLQNPLLNTAVFDETNEFYPYIAYDADTFELKIDFWVDGVELWKSELYQRLGFDHTNGADVLPTSADVGANITYTAAPGTDRNADATLDSDLIYPTEEPPTAKTYAGEDDYDRIYDALRKLYNTRVLLQIASYVATHEFLDVLLDYPEVSATVIDTALFVPKTLTEREDLAGLVEVPTPDNIPAGELLDPSTGVVVNVVAV